MVEDLSVNITIAIQMLDNAEVGGAPQRVNVGTVVILGDHDQDLIRVDVLGSFYTIIRNAYSSQPIDIAHPIVEQEILKYGPSDKLVLYLDSPPSQENLFTQVRRDAARQKNLTRASIQLLQLENRVNSNLRVRKQHLLGVRKHLKSAFYWSLADRQAFAQYFQAKKAKGLVAEGSRTEVDPSLPAIENFSRPAGTIITKLLSNVGKSEPRKEPRSFKDSTSMMDLAAMREHIQSLWQANFDPRNYTERSYVHQGSIRTDGFRLQIRNVVKTQQDVIDLWGCALDQIKILSIDLGQACVVGASLLLPEDHDPGSATTVTGEKCDDADMASPSEDASQPQVPATFRNLAVKQKAVYQPTFKHRRWMEEQKNIVLGNGIESISNIETKLSPLRGQGISFTNHVVELEKVEERLQEFYNGNNRFKKHKWDARRARDAEYRFITESLLKAVGGNIGRKRDETNKVNDRSRPRQVLDKGQAFLIARVFQSYFGQVTWIHRG
ncbi:hypothetical protein BC939DRAFT_508611 [Gamsiella multidivaricata]|uniref:uncharacterized protein n=1 Tax=Gamsiella multidivaricata TaxID=101098 RepID=UPI0022202FA3|nr:uncharacterized protein BC939DRAFT_508611 [Gamsiella multidivaricata]KAI7816130.1 hypothetical protein BC939DRAFT_508611 [Gamsiella multidivaricata]